MDKALPQFLATIHNFNLGKIMSTPSATVLRSGCRHFCKAQRITISTVHDHKIPIQESGLVCVKLLGKTRRICKRQILDFALQDKG